MKFADSQVLGAARHRAKITGLHNCEVSHFTGVGIRRIQFDSRKVLDNSYLIGLFGSRAVNAKWSKLR